ncbi:MAG: YtxH domain-containing protein [Oscillospiraceae bacterium]|nr:YtxH domain-containing protein [Oscillospiraceae bacterium]
MNTKQFLSGMGMGIVAGSAIGMLVSPRSRRSKAKSSVSKALKNVGDILDSLS